jgi:uncharacterized membrane protein YbhN (UPF0104 family)
MLNRLSPRGRQLLRIAVTVLLTVVLLYFVLRGIQPAELEDILSEISPLLALAGAVAAFAFIVSRAWRYALLLSTNRRQWRMLLAITLTGWGASLILPGPSGDATFVWLTRSRLKTPVAVGVGAALLSRLLDVASLVIIALVTAPIAGVRLPRLLLVGGVLVAVVIAAGLTALFWDRPRGVIVTWLERLRLPTAIHERLHFAVEELGSGSRPFLLVTGTIAGRVATMVQYLALFAALGQALSPVQVWFALSVRTLLLAVPLQGIGGLGTTQVWWTAGLTLLGWPAGVALASSLAVHLLDLCVSLPQAAAGWLVLRTRRVGPEAELPAMSGAVSRPD